MATLEISSGLEVIGVSESVSGQGDDLNPNKFDAVTVAEAITRDPCYVISKVDSVTVAESVTTPTFSLTLYRGTKSVTVSAITLDWEFVKAYKEFKNVGVKLKGIVLIPGSGGPDTFAIKDGSDTGAYLYKAAVSAATVLVYPGSECKPYIDYSECTLSAGHMVTFIW